MADVQAEHSVSGNTKKDDPLETAKWTQYLPEAFGIREAVRQSSYRWCVREGYDHVFFWRRWNCDDGLMFLFSFTFKTTMLIVIVEECGGLQRVRP